MNCTQAQDRFSELLDQRHAAPASGDVRTHLASCPNCRKEFAALKRTLSALDALPVLPPSPRLRANFYAMLEEEINSAACARGAERRRQRITTWRWILSPIAACGLLALGFLAGQRHMPGPVTNPLPTANDTQQELAELRQKVDSMSQLVGYSLQQQNSAGQRLQSIFATNTRQAPDQQVIAQLINALALDPSVNVRLAALETLYAYADQDTVRAGVLASLVREPNPLVQVSMIDFLAAARDPGAAQAFESIARDEQLDRAVRDAASRALVQL
jgi:hypothetical protein